MNALSKNKESTGRYFDSRAPNYLEENYGETQKYPTLQIRHRHLLEMAGKGGGFALDAGCGSGALLIDISAGGRLTLGFDIAPKMLGAARWAFRDGTGEEALLSLNDLEAMPYRDDSFDLVTCAGVVEYLDDDEAALEEISRVLRRGGTALISVTNASTPLWITETVLKLLGAWRQVYSSIKGGEPFPRARVHVPSRFSWKASRYGLREVDRVYFHFSPLPFPLDNVFMRLCREPGLRMERYSRSMWGFLGRGCILKFVNDG